MAKSVELAYTIQGGKYYRRRSLYGARKIPLPDDPVARVSVWQQLNEGVADLDAFIEGLKRQTRSTTTKIVAGRKSGTLRSIVELYLDSDQTKEWKPHTRTYKSEILFAVCDSINLEANMQRGDIPLNDFKPVNIAKIKHAMAAPEGDDPDRRRREGRANRALEALSGFFSWAIRKSHYKFGSPVKGDDCQLFVIDTKGRIAWKPRHVEAFRQRHPIGTIARLAFELMFATGVRRSDVIKLNPREVEGDVLTFVETKNGSSKCTGQYRRRVPKENSILIEGELLSIIKATPHVDQLDASLDRYIQHDGRPYKDVTFGKHWARWCDEAGLPKNLRSHGVRKAGATDLVVNGGTHEDLMVFGGWTKDEVARLYIDPTRRIEHRRRIARARADKSVARLKTVS
jgi:integrase